MVNIGGGFPAHYRGEVPEIQQYANAVMTAITRYFGNDLPEIVVEPGRSIVGDAGVIQSEVVLISRKAAGEEKRWVYLDVGKFNGLAETMDESIKYRIKTPADGGATGPIVLAGPTCDSADILYEKTEYQLPLDLKVGDRVRDPVHRGLHLDVLVGGLQRLPAAEDLLHQSRRDGRAGAAARRARKAASAGSPRRSLGSPPPA